MYKEGDLFERWGKGRFKENVSSAKELEFKREDCVPATE